MEAYPEEVLPDKDARMWGMLCHLGSLSMWIGVPFGNFIVPLVILLTKGKEHPFIEDQAKEVLNFQISLLLYFLGSLLLCLIIIGIIPLLLIVIGAPILTIIAAIRANDGEEYRYPFTIRFID